MNAVLLFLKHPTPGLVKTRLAATVGAEMAVGIYRQMVEQICRSLPTDAALILVYDPPECEAALRAWLLPCLSADENRCLLWHAQCAGDLGARLTAAFEFAFSNGFQQVAAIGSDCVDLNASVFSEAFAQLAGNDVVIGPAWDGGYYLLATKAHQPALFKDIPWSTEETLARTVARAAENDLGVFLLEKRHDVDTEEDWQRAVTLGILPPLNPKH